LIEMGLLDALRNGDDPGGGLLAFLQSIQPGQGPQMGPLPSDQAQYGGSPVNASPPGQAPVFASAGAQQSAPQMAAPAPPTVITAQPQQPPTATPAPSSGIGDSVLPIAQGAGNRLIAGLQGFAHSGGVIPAIANGLTGLFTGQRTDPAGVAQQQQTEFRNLTAKALLLKGADPTDVQAAVGGNTVLMKQLIDKYYGTGDRDYALKVQEAARAQLNADRTFGLAKRSADRADEGPVEQAGYRAKVARSYGLDPNSAEGRAFIVSGKLPDSTPNSALEYKFYKDNLANGETPVSYQQWLATKDSDPNKINTLGRDGELWKRGPNGEPVILHKNQPAAPGAQLDDETLTSMAGQYLAGDKSVFTNIGRGTQGAENIIRLRQRVKEVADAQGMKPADVAHRIAEFSGDMASQRTLGVRQTNADMAVTEAQKMSDLALAASQNVPRSNYPKVNAAIQAYRENTGDPNVMRFGAANLAFVNTYARAISPTGTPTVHDKIAAVAEGKLSTANSHAQYAAIVDQMRQEMAAAKAAPAQVKQDLRDAAAGRHTVSQGSGADAMLAHAREALAQGAPRAAVLQRLQQAGVDTSGL
jgi:hypothetical protein